MTLVQTEEPTPHKPLRLWPGVVAVGVQWLAWVVIPIVAPEATRFAVLGALACGLAVVAWWLFFSRAAWSERVGAIVLMVVAVVAAKRVAHQSIAGGMMGMLLPIYAIPVLSLALVASALATRRLSRGLRRATMIGAILLACGVFTLLRTGGIVGEAGSEFHWRWTKTPEERLLAQGGGEPVPLPSTPPAETPAPAAPRTPEKPGPDPAGPATGADWPGFRGTQRDSVVRGVRIETDWSSRHRSRCGAGRSDQAGRPSRSMAIPSTPRSSAVTMSLCRATT